MWFIGVEVEQETSSPPPLLKQILDPPLTDEGDFPYSRSLIDSPFSLPACAGLAVPGNTTGQHLIGLIFMHNDVKNSS